MIFSSRHGFHVILFFNFNFFSCFIIAETVNKLVTETSEHIYREYLALKLECWSSSKLFGVGICKYCFILLLWALPNYTWHLFILKLYLFCLLFVTIPLVSTYTSILK